MAFWLAVKRSIGSAGNFDHQFQHLFQVFRLVMLALVGFSEGDDLADCLEAQW
jgi:hypothetical protein